MLPELSLKPEATSCFFFEVVVFRRWDDSIYISVWLYRNVSDVLSFKQLERRVEAQLQLIPSVATCCTSIARNKSLDLRMCRSG